YTPPAGPHSQPVSRKDDEDNGSGEPEEKEHSPKIEDVELSTIEQPDSNDNTQSTNTTPAPPVNREKEDNRPIAARCTKRNVQPPGEWWKIKPTFTASASPHASGSWQAREPTPAISSDSEDSEEDKLYDSDTEEEANVVREVEPTTWTEAMNGPYAEQWKEACLEEIKAHMENGTWTVEDLPEQEKAIGSKWVFKIKHNADGSIERFKARIVAKGFSQQLDFDYSETFAPTMRYS